MSSILLIAIWTSAGAQLDSCGLDKKAALNVYEVDFLNKLYLSWPDSIDFENKTVAFITGSEGRRISSKVEFFNNIKRWTLAGSSIATFPIVLSPEEKRRSGGYDVILTHWVKYFSKRRRKRTIKKLRARDAR